MVPHLPFLSTHVYGIHLFPPISVYFLPIFCLKWYHILVINSITDSICCFFAHMFTDSAYFPPIFRSFSAYFPPNFLPIFRWSCLAGLMESNDLGGSNAPVSDIHTITSEHGMQQQQLCMYRHKIKYIIIQYI